MSKKSKHEAMLKEQAAKLRSETRKPPITAKTRAAANKSGGAARNGVNHSSAGRTYSSQSQKVTRITKVDPNRLMTVRIIAIVLAVVALAGAVYWGYSVRGNYTPGVIVGIIVLGFLAGFSILIAVRTQDIVTRAIQYQRR